MEEDYLCKTYKNGVFRLKVNLLPMSSLLIRIDTNRRLDSVKEKFLKAGFKETENAKRIRGTCKLKGKAFPALIDFTDGLKEKSMADEGYDKEFPMQIAISLDYNSIEKPKNDQLKALAKEFVSEYGITKLIEKAELVNKGE